MGIISGFIGGVGKGMADAGKMMFADKIQKERDEANFLRDKELNKSKQDFTASEGQKDRDAAMDRTKYKTDEKAKSDAAKEDKPTSQQKNAKALIDQGYPKDIANAVAQGGLKQIKDEDTGDMVLVNALNNTPVGRLTTVGNKKTWVPEGTEVEQPISTKDLKEKAKAMNKESGTDNDWIPFNELDRKDPEVRAALEKERQEKKGGGLVGSQMKKTETQETPAMDTPAPGAGDKEVKMIGKRKMTKQEYIDAMIAKYGEDQRAVIEKQWADK